MYKIEIYIVEISIKETPNEELSIHISENRQSFEQESLMKNANG